MHRIAGHFLKRSSPYDLAASYYSHLSVIGEQPDNFAAWMSIAETLLAAHFLDYFIWPGRTIHHIEEAVAAAIRLNPDDWQSHAISGTLCLARRQFHEASVHYQAALHCDPNDMPRYGWYQAFLFAADRSDEALELLLTRTIENPTDAMDYAIYGLGLYAARMFDAAEEELQMAIQLDSQCWLAYLVNSLNYIALDEPDLAILNIERLENIPRRFQWRMFGPMILAFHMEIQSSSEPSERNYYKRRFAKIIRHLEKQEWYLNERNDPRTYRYRELGFDWPQYNVPWYGLQMAGVLMAAGQSEFAIEHIEVAWSAGSPLIMWLHQMPIFDPLLKYDRFQYLLRHRLDHPPGH
jgi:tetratricopeptide (TPR) repeat protein